MAEKRKRENAGKTRQRPSWDEYFTDLIVETARRSSCLKRHVGAIIVRNKRILATGYNGAPSGIENCVDENYCWRVKHKIAHGESKDLCMAAHAEANAIYDAANRGVAINESELYVTTFPCPICAIAIIQSGIKEVNYIREYYGKQRDFSAYLLRKAGIKTRKLKADLKKIAREHPGLNLR